MAKSKSKANSRQSAPATNTPSSSRIETVFHFPFAQYASVAGTSSVLVSFCAVALPSSAKYLGFKPLPQTSSNDRPQPSFLNPVTANPAGTVFAVSLGILAVMLWWSGWVRQWWASETKIERIENSTKRAQEKIFAIQGAAILTAIGTFIYYILLVLMGAPILTHPISTLSLATLLSVLTAYTPSYTLPLPNMGIPYINKHVAGQSSLQQSDTDSLVNQLTWLRLFSEVKVDTPTERILVYPFIGTLAGAWIGVIPLALDWDRPWQAWPLLPAYGAITGYVVASLLALIVSGWRRLIELGQKAKTD